MKLRKNNPRRHFRKNMTTCPLLQMFCFKKCPAKNFTLSNLTWNKYTKFFFPPSTLCGDQLWVFVLLARTWGPLSLFVPSFSPLPGAWTKKNKKKWMKVCVYGLQVHALHKLPCIYLFVYKYVCMYVNMYVYVCVCVCLENLCFLGFCFWGLSFMSILFSTWAAQGCRWWMCCGWWKGWRRRWFCLPATRVVVVVVVVASANLHTDSSQGGKGKK